MYLRKPNDLREQERQNSELDIKGVPTISQIHCQAKIPSLIIRGALARLVEK